ncbi:hypothetical protein [Pantoea sp. A4]|uniref:hypothetical protein n=1 Tax=Pantoea sp. A4 TaxID=1225184 RepID=UPI00037785FD|nr:hypothetical protein [Pantoea sp. A4]
MNDKVVKSTEHHNEHSVNTAEEFKPRIRGDGEIYAADLELTIDDLASKVPEGIVNLSITKTEAYIYDAISVIKYITNGMVNTTSSLLRSKVANIIDSIIHSGFPALRNYPVISDLNFLYPVFKSLTDTPGIINKIKIAMEQAALFVARLPLTITGRGLISVYFQHLKLILPTAVYAILDTIEEYKEMFSSWLSFIPGFEDLDVGDLSVVLLCLFLWSFLIKSGSVPRLKTALGKSIQAAYNMTNWLPSFFGWLGLLNSPAAPAQLGDSGGIAVSVTEGERDSFASTSQDDSDEPKESSSWLSKFLNSLQDPLKFPTAMATDQQSDGSQVDNLAEQQNNEVDENAKNEIYQSIDHFISALRSPEKTGTLYGLSLVAMNELKNDQLKTLDVNKAFNFHVEYDAFNTINYKFVFSGRDSSNNSVVVELTHFQIANFSLKNASIFEPTFQDFSRKMVSKFILLDGHFENSSFSRIFPEKKNSPDNKAYMFNPIDDERVIYMNENPSSAFQLAENLYFSPAMSHPDKQIIDNISSALYEVKKIFQFSRFIHDRELTFHGLNVAEVNDFLSACYIDFDWDEMFNLELQYINGGYHLNIFAKDKRSNAFDEKVLSSTDYFSDSGSVNTNANKVLTVIKILINRASPEASQRQEGYIINDAGLVKLTHPENFRQDHAVYAANKRQQDIGNAESFYIRNQSTQGHPVYGIFPGFRTDVENYGDKKTYTKTISDTVVNQPGSKKASLPKVRELLSDEINALFDSLREYIINYMLDRGYPLESYSYMEAMYLKEFARNAGLNITMNYRSRVQYNNGAWKNISPIDTSGDFNSSEEKNFQGYEKVITDSLVAMLESRISNEGFSLPVFYPTSLHFDITINIRYPDINKDDYKMSDHYTRAFGISYDNLNRKGVSGYSSIEQTNRALYQKISQELKDNHNILSRSPTLQSAITYTNSSQQGTNSDQIDEAVVREYYKLQANQIGFMQEHKLHTLKFQKEFLEKSLMDYLNINESKYDDFKNMEIGVARVSVGGEKAFNRDVSFLELLYNDVLRKAVGNSFFYPLRIRRFREPSRYPGGRWKTDSWIGKNSPEIIAQMGGYLWDNSSPEVIAQFFVDCKLVNESEKLALQQKMQTLFVDKMDTKVVPKEIANPVGEYKKRNADTIDEIIGEVSALEADKILLLSADAPESLYKGNVKYVQRSEGIDAKSLLTANDLRKIDNRMKVVKNTLEAAYNHTVIDFYTDDNVWTMNDYKDLFIQLLRILPLEETQAAMLIYDIASGAGIEQISEDFIFVIAPFLDEFRVLGSLKLGELLQDGVQLKILADSVVQLVDAWKKGDAEGLSTALLGVGMSGHGLMKSGARIVMPRKYEVPYQVHDINGEKFVITSDVSERVSFDGNDKPVIRKGGLIKSSEMTASGEMTFSEEWVIDEEQAKETYKCEIFQVRSRKRRGLEACLVIENTALTSFDFDTNQNPLPVEGTDLPQDTEFHPWGADWKISATKVDGTSKKQPVTAWILPYEGKFFKAEPTATDRVPKVLKSTELSDYKLPQTPEMHATVKPKLLHRKGYNGHVEINQLEKNLPDSKATLPVSILPRMQVDPNAPQVTNTGGNNSPTVRVTEDFVMNFDDNWYFGTKTRGDSESTTIDEMTMKSDVQLSPEEKEAKKLHATLMSASFHHKKLQSQTFKKLVATIDSHPVAQSSGIQTKLHDVDLSTGEKYLFDKQHRVTLQKMHRQQGGSVWESYDSPNFSSDDTYAVNYNKDIMEALYPDNLDFDTTKSDKDKNVFLKGKNYVLFTMGDESFLVLSGAKVERKFIPKVFEDTRVSDKIPNIKVEVTLSGNNNVASKGKKHYVTFVNLDPDLNTKITDINSNLEYPPALPTAATPEQLGEPVKEFKVTFTRENDSERMLAAFMASSKVIENGQDIFVFNRNDACKSCAALLETLFNKARDAGTTNIRHVFIFPYDKY